MKYMHKETGSIDDREGWILSYHPEELANRGITAEEAFEEDEERTLFKLEGDTILKSRVFQMIKSVGNNSDGGYFTDADLVGDYEKVDPPENWEEVLKEAADNTPGGMNLEVGKREDWEWFRDDKEREGYLTGESWLVAQWIEDSTVESVED